MMNNNIINNNNPSILLESVRIWKDNGAFNVSNEKQKHIALVRDLSSYYEKVQYINCHLLLKSDSTAWSSPSRG